MASEPIHDIAHLAHLELLTPKFEESRRFFIDVMGMTQSGEKGDSVFLRGWDDYERYSLKLTASKTSGLGHVAFRTRSPQALERRAAALKGSGFDIGWSDGDFGHGKTFEFRDPDGHKFEIYYETEWYEAPPELKPALKNQAQRYPARGINVRRIDHFNGLAVDIKANREFFQNYLGFMLTEQIVLDDGTEAGMWMTATNKSYDFAYTRDYTGTKGRLHHVTFALDAREDVLRAADVILENGVYIETGPHKHAIQQTFFLYVYEPGGNRVEVSCAGARLVLAPDWKPITWSEAERKKGQAGGLQTIRSFHTKGTPPVPRRPARGRGRAHRRLGHLVRANRRRAAQGGRRKIRRAARGLGGRRGQGNRLDRLGGHRRLQPGGRTLGRAASCRQSLLPRHQFGFARPQAADRRAHRRTRALHRRRGGGRDPSGAPPHAAVDRRTACRGRRAAVARTGNAIQRGGRTDRCRRRHQDGPQRDDQGHRGAHARVLPGGESRRRARGGHRLAQEQLPRARLGKTV